MDQATNKAKIVKVFQVEGIELRLSEKGAVVIYKQAPDTSYRFSHSLTPAMVKMHAEDFGCPVFQSIVESPEWKQTLETKELNKVKAQVDRIQAKNQDKLAKTIQAARDQIIALGGNPDLVFGKQA